VISVSRRTGYLPSARPHAFRTTMLTRLHRTIHLLRNRHLANALLATHEEFARTEDYSLWGSLSDQEQSVINRLIGCASRHPGPIIEVGTLFGLTTQLIATSKDRDRELITIDNYSWNPFSIPPGHHRKFTHRALRYCTLYCNTRIFDGSNRTFYSNYAGETPAMIFIDADHSYEGVLVDIAWAKKMRIPIISGHDYSTRFPGIVRAVEESFGPNFKVEESIWYSTSF
jgi:hypothetical protein